MRGTAQVARSWSTAVRTTRFTGTSSRAAKAKAAAPIPGTTLKVITPAPKQDFSFQFAGVAGKQYIVQASADLVHWSSMQTNIAPFTYTNFDTTNFPKRFYRAVVGP